MKDQSVICLVSLGARCTSAPTAPLIGSYPIYNHQKQRRQQRNGREREQKRGGWEGEWGEKERTTKTEENKIHCQFHRIWHVLLFFFSVLTAK